jgi:hypothetical protein
VWFPSVWLGGGLPWYVVVSLYGAVPSCVAVWLGGWCVAVVAGFTLVLVWLALVSCVPPERLLPRRSHGAPVGGRPTTQLPLSLSQTASRAYDSFVRNFPLSP